MLNDISVFLGFDLLSSVWNFLCVNYVKSTSNCSLSRLRNSRSLYIIWNTPSNYHCTYLTAVTLYDGERLPVASLTINYKVNVMLLNVGYSIDH